MISDEVYMKRCLDLASRGKGLVAPNPMVGALVVCEDQIIGEGYHQQFGGPHAEVHALQGLDDDVLKRSTLYVNLEPCAHHGKTPPCADLIVQKQLKRVVIACQDSYSEVAGKGIEKLIRHGIKVHGGVLEQESRELNKRFFHFHEQKRPYVILKWAQSLDGFMDAERNDTEKGPIWISSPESQVLSHHWRSEEQAILIGRNTLETDDPSLTVRRVHGKNPIRVLLDSKLSVAGHYQLFNDEAPTLILNQLKDEISGNMKYMKLPAMSAEKVLEALYQENIQSVIIEGGQQVLNSFISENLWNEARVITGPVKLKQGLPAPVLQRIPDHSEKHFNDRIHRFFNT
ncbi:MAG: bifunctional diaminohydroxyphosphoribosylaminopyrimidine deaminase/5-amino-6-(5-phosphoribosylamino)uracil reductase RibD [Bacteroidetes bacterium]|nr:MAG: bifunctional diaminohydroxyphosphoribosylaminopyrimidine deaminase/5-amino-6-(5-phosphoribosylamino)uracil reductase RibD [Bacteroidota bacterium]